MKSLQHSSPTTIYSGAEAVDTINSDQLRNSPVLNYKFDYTTGPRSIYILA